VSEISGTRMSAAPPPLEGARRRGKIDFGLPAAGHAEEEEGGVARGVERGLDLAQRGALLLRRAEGVARKARGRDVPGVAARGGGATAPGPVPDAAGDRGAQHLAPRREIVVGDPAREIEHRGVEDGPPGRHLEERFQIRARCG
jgi:hypothetical protein